MAKSQKLLMAVALLACGYGLALVWNATANFIWPLSPLSSGPADRAVSLAPSTPIDGVQLVPTIASDQSAGPQAVPVGNPTASTGGSSAHAPLDAHPTWLSAGPQAKIVGVGTNLNPPAGQANPEENVIKASPSLFVVDTGADRENPIVMPLLSAQVTAVTPIEDPASTDASPWDRWPQWQPASATISGPITANSTAAASEPTNRVVAAVDQQPATSTPSPTAFQTSFNAIAPSASAENSLNRLVPVSQPLTGADGEDAEPQTHSIVDGDSLAKLAERFLGDPLQGDRIYQLNRDMLTSPDLLPIGAELKLPMRQSLTTNHGPATPNTSHTATVSTSPPGLVPVEDIRKTFVGMPRAQLLRPLPPVEPALSPATQTAYATTGH